MVYDVKWTVTADKQFGKLDKSTKKEYVDTSTKSRSQKKYLLSMQNNIVITKMIEVF